MQIVERAHITRLNPARSPLTIQTLALLAIAALLIGLFLSAGPMGVARAATTVTAGPDTDAANNE